MESLGFFYCDVSISIDEIKFQLLAVWGWYKVDEMLS